MISSILFGYFFYYDVTDICVVANDDIVYNYSKRCFVSSQRNKQMPNI